MKYKTFSVKFSKKLFKYLNEIFLRILNDRK